MANNNVRQKIRDYIGERLSAKGDTASFGDQDILMTKGRLDSLDTLNVVMFLEEEFMMDFSDGLDKNLLDSVDAIVALVEGRRIVLEDRRKIQGE